MNCQRNETMSDIEREAFKRTERHFKQAKTPAKIDEWVKSSERLPVEADGDCYGVVWVYDKALSKVVDCHSLDVKFISDFTHWKATRLTCPKPPKEQDNEG